MDLFRFFWMYVTQNCLRCFANVSRTDFSFFVKQYAENVRKLVVFSFCLEPFFLDTMCHELSLLDC